jgi:hypothetical protein
MEEVSACPGVVAAAGMATADATDVAPHENDNVSYERFRRVVHDDHHNLAPALHRYCPWDGHKFLQGETTCPECATPRGTTNVPNSHIYLFNLLILNNINKSVCPNFIFCKIFIFDF